MDYKTLNTKGISYLDLVPGTDRWYWGMDYTQGDLYEAEELFRDGHAIQSNRLILVSYPEGNVMEPVKAAPGQYFGNAVFWEGRIHFLLVDFEKKKILIYRCSEDCSEAAAEAELPLSTVKDCYNLMLEIEPLTLIRQGHENTFQVVWPEWGDFAIDPTESLDSRDGDVLVFSKWFEDPDYREETVLRRYPTGEITENVKAAFKRMPDGQKWLLR